MITNIIYNDKTKKRYILKRAVYTIQYTIQSFLFIIHFSGGFYR